MIMVKAERYEDLNQQAGMLEGAEIVRTLKVTMMAATRLSLRKYEPGCVTA
jgi:hypothetical protein